MTNLDQEIDEILFKLRTTHEVEHNNNQWTTEFVYTLEEAKAAINQLITEARIEELEGFTYSGASAWELEERIKQLRSNNNE